MLNFLAALPWLLAMLLLPAGLVLMIFRSKRETGELLAGGAVFCGILGIFTAIFLFDSRRDHKGFLSADDLKAATAAGISDPALWEKQKAAEARAEAAKREAVLRAEAESRAAEATKKAAEDDAKMRLAIEANKAKCLADAACWADRHARDAELRCGPVIESMAKIDFEWIAKPPETKITSYRWKNKDYQKKGIITYAGDGIKLQNGFGNWIRHIYECDYNPLNAEVLEIRLKPGRL